MLGEATGQCHSGQQWQSQTLYHWPLLRREAGKHMIKENQEGSLQTEENWCNYYNLEKFIKILIYLFCNKMERMITTLNKSLLYSTESIPPYSPHYGVCIISPIDSLIGPEGSENNVHMLFSWSQQLMQGRATLVICYYVPDYAFHKIALRVK